MFHLFGIHVLSKFSIPLFTLLSSRMHIDSEISLSLVRGTSETLFFELKPYFIFFPLFGILKFTKKNSFTCFCYKWCVKFSFGSIMGYQIKFVSLVRETCVIGIVLSHESTFFISDAYWFGNISFRLFWVQVNFS